MKKLAVIVSVAALALSGCSWFSSAPEGATAAGGVTKESVTAQITAAEAALKKAGAGSWRDTEKMIKEAKAALEKGELENAMKLAKEAEYEGKMGEQQAAEQKNAKPWLF
jgi:hypothetical protein